MLLTVRIVQICVFFRMQPPLFEAATTHLLERSASNRRQYTKHVPTAENLFNQVISPHQVKMATYAALAGAAENELDCASCAMSLSRGCLFGAPDVVSCYWTSRRRRFLVSNYPLVGTGHGGHLEHALQWFGGLQGKAVRETCPTGCGHRCNLLQQISAFPRTTSMKEMPPSSCLDNLGEFPLLFCS